MTKSHYLFFYHSIEKFFFYSIFIAYFNIISFFNTNFLSLSLVVNEMEEIQNTTSTNTNKTKTKNSLPKTEQNHLDSWLVFKRQKQKKPRNQITLGQFVHQNNQNTKAKYEIINFVALSQLHVAISVTLSIWAPTPYT